MNNKTIRIASIDIFRALTMLLMIFVNDIPGLGETIPHWFHHALTDEDMLGLSDVVFPCFLFCVGLSVPFAIKNRIAKGDSNVQMLSHIAQRTIALLVMGLFTSNGFTQTAEAVGIAAPWFKLIFMAAFFMIWNVYPQATGTTKKVFSLLQICGWVILAVLALIFIGKPTRNEMVVSSGCIPIAFANRPQYIYQYLLIAACAIFPIAANFLRTRNKTKLLLQSVICIVIFYLFLFKGANSNGLVGLRPGWWQILGLIGWTYLYTAVIFIFTKNKMLPNIIAWLFFTFLCIAANIGWIKSLGIAGWIPGDGSFLSLSFAGVTASRLMQRNAGKEKFGKLSSTYIAIAVLMFAAALVAHKYFIISKIQATCTWIFFCLAISFACLIFIHWLTDIKGKKSWFNIIKPAGTSTLTCYIIPSIWYSVVLLTGITFPAFMRAGIAGLAKSLVYAFAVIGITWLLGKIGIKLKI
jgi:predicted acyltransferase